MKGFEHRRQLLKVLNIIKIAFHTVRKTLYKSFLFSILSKKPQTPGLWLLL
jgi:hypothetical protein